MHEMMIHADQGKILVCLYGIARTLVMRVAHPDIWFGFEECSGSGAPLCVFSDVRLYCPKGWVGFFGHRRGEPMCYGLSFPHFRLATISSKSLNVPSGPIDEISGLLGPSFQLLDSKVTLLWISLVPFFFLLHWTMLPM